MSAKRKESHEQDELAAIVSSIRRTTRSEWLERISAYEAEYAGAASPIRVETVSSKANSVKNHQTTRRSKPAAAPDLPQAE